MPPKDLPRHEIIDKKESKKNYETLRDELKKKQIENSSPVDKVTLKSDKKLADGVIDQLSKKFLAIGEKLISDALTLFSTAHGTYPGALDSVGQWRTKCKISNGDLSSFWNDLKQEKAEFTSLSVLKHGFPDLTDHAASQTRMIKLFDLLELAEKNGGLGDWLDQFRTELISGSPQWNSLATIAECIQLSINFNQGLIDSLRNETGAEFDLSTRKICTDLSFALSAIAQEVGIQMKQYQAGTEFKLMSPLDSVRSRLREHTHSAQVVDRINQALKDGTLKDTWNNQITISVDNQSSANLTAALSQLTTKDKEVSELVNKIGHSSSISDAVQEAKVRELAKTLTDTSIVLTDILINSGISKKPPLLQEELALFTREFMKILIDRLENYKKRITSTTARKVITELISLNDASSNTIAGPIKILSERYPSFSVYRDARDYFTKAQLGVLWSRDFQAIISNLTIAGKPEYSLAVAGNLTALDSASFAELLNKWTPNLSEEKAVGLIWRTHDSLRSIKSEIEANLNVDVHQDFKQFLANTLDAITVLIAEKVKDYQ